MNYTDDQLKANYEKFIEYIDKSFSGERLEKLLHMYSEDELGPNLMMAPASSVKWYHNTYDGGYIDHVLNVVKISLKMMDLYESQGGRIDFTADELVFAAFHHDLGKLGEPGQPYYLPNDSKWHIENQGKYYKNNPNLVNMTVTDRSFFMLQKYGIEYNQNEWYGIRLADGMYEETNEGYFKNYDPNKFIQSRLPYILHWADHMSTNVERDTALF